MNEQVKPLSQAVALPETKIDYKAIALSDPGQGVAQLMPRNFGEVVAFSELMARSDCAVRKHFRNNPGACMAVSLQAMRWQLDPFAVANKSFFVNDQLAFEAQLLGAVIISRAPIIGRPKYRYEGEGPELKCIVIVKTRDGETIEHESPRVKEIKTKNSPLWQSDVRQQLGYYTLRAMSRLHFPDVILGAYDRDEIIELTPAPRADRSQAAALAANLAANAPTGDKGFDPAFVDAETGEIVEPAKSTASDPSRLLDAAHEKALQGRRSFDPWFNALSETDRDAMKSHMPALMKAANLAQHGASNEAAKIIEHDAPAETKAAPAFDFDVEMDAFEKMLATFTTKAELLAFGESVQKGGWYVAADEDLREQAQTLFQDRVKELEKSEAKAKAKKPTQQAALEAGFEEIPHFQDDGPANAAEQEPSEAEKLLTDGRMAAINGVRKLKFWLGKLNAAQFELIKPHKESLEAAARQADEAL